MPTHYLLATPWEHFALHAEYVRQAKRGETTVVFQHRRDDHITDITICTPDLPQPGLLSQILGIIYALDITIHEARAASTREPQPIALDVISTSYQGHCLPENLCRILSRELKTRLGNAQAVNAWIREKGKDPERRQEMLTYRFHEGNPAILDIETPLGRGMPYRVTKMLASLGWNVEVARIGQWAGRAVARFYVSSPKNKALTRREVQRRLKNL
jgi:UTP:GlnB (protein PII) uridylyltransferase